MEEEIELADLFSILWKKKKFIIITMIIFAIIAFLGTIIIENFQNDEETQEISTMYYAQTTFLVATSETTTTTIEQPLAESTPVNVTENSKNSVDNTIINTYSEILKSQTILNNVKTKLNLTENLYDSISLSRIFDSNLLSIVVAYKDEQQAIQIADELMNEFINTMSQTYFIDKVSVIDKAHLLSNEDFANMFKEYIVNATNDGTSLENMLVDLDFSKLIPDQKLKEIFETYLFSNDAIEHLDITNTLEDIIGIENSRIVIYTICSGILGFIISFGIILIMEIFIKTIKDENHITDKSLGLVEYNGAKNVFDILRIKLETNKLISITSSENSDKNIYISENLAIAFANIQKKTLLIDLTSNANALLKKSNEKGLFDFLKDSSKKIENYISKSDIENLDIMLVGTENTYCLKEKEFKDMLSTLENNYDYIIINSNNILEDANSLQLAKTVKNTILVAIQRKTKLNDYLKTKETISEVNGNILGTILIK